MKPSELGQYLFPVLRNLNLNDFRALHLTGAEAAEVLDEDVQEYLAQRTRAALQEKMETIHAQLPRGGIYVDLALSNEMSCTLFVRSQTSTEIAIPLGQAAYVGSILRLV